MTPISEQWLEAFGFQRQVKKYSDGTPMYLKWVKVFSFDDTDKEAILTETLEVYMLPMCFTWPVRVLAVCSDGAVSQYSVLRTGRPLYCEQVEKLYYALRGE